MNNPTNDWAPARKAEATTNISTLNYSTSTAVGEIDTPCICELWGPCPSCERLPWVLRQRQITQTVNSSPMTWRRHVQPDREDHGPS